MAPEQRRSFLQPLKILLISFAALMCFSGVVCFIARSAYNYPAALFAVGRRWDRWGTPVVGCSLDTACTVCKFERQARVAA